jgi:REP element-mobilizing transposase RayT
MARKQRIDEAGAWHHVMNRGARRGDVFTRDEHCVAFLDLLGEVTFELGWEVHAWALMPNHFHLLVRSVEGNLSRCMQTLCGRYTRRLNVQEGWDGPTFRGRFRNQRIVDARYLRHLVAYIHLNPVRARLVRRADEDCWTSHRAHLGLDSPPAWLARWMVEQEFGSPEQLQAYVRDVHSGREPWPEELDLATGWLSQPAAAKAQFSRAPLDPDASPAVLTADEVLSRVVGLTGASQPEIGQATHGPAANPPRRFAAWMLARHTTLTHAEIGAALGMSRRQVESLLYRLRTRGASAPLTEWRDAWEQVAAPVSGSGGARGGDR